MGIKKRRISLWYRFRSKSCEKMHPNKVICKNVVEICTFFTFTHVCQTCFAYNFFCVHFLTIFSNRFEIGMKFCIFWYLFRFFSKNYFFLVILVLIESQTRKKRLKKSKNVFCKCVLDFNFAPIKGSVFLIFFKKVKFVVPYCSLSSAEMLSVEWSDTDWGQIPPSPQLI